MLILLTLHFFGLAMVLARTFARTIDGRVGTIGIALLWASGLGMLQLKWGGVANMGSLPWTFHLKLTLVAIVTGVIAYLQALESAAADGAAMPAARIRLVSRIISVLAAAIVILAVVSFH